MQESGEINKKALTERDICTKYITPAIVSVGWDLKKQIREGVYFTNGRIIVKGDKISRGERKFADYILYYKPNLPVAIIEAKDNNHSIGAGLQQALEYGSILDIPFIFSSNGDGFIMHDRSGMADMIEKEISLDNFPNPDNLWDAYKKGRGIADEQEKIITEAYYLTSPTKKPRYYQEIAINRAVEAIAQGKRRILIVMATGTGKTFVASQIVYRLWKAKVKKRILYLSDRKILVNQPMNNDFKVFKGAMTKVTNRKVDHSFEIYMALYQGLSGEEDWKNIYKQFSKDFFDLVIVDECHRGSAAIDSAWREILEYFSNATQIGMTATPKETKEISNIDYFGEPIYVYSLKQGIEDGFLAPYKVIRISIDKDVEGWRPNKGELDKYGEEIPDRIYNMKDFDRELVIDERTLLVAQKITEFLKNSDDRYAKTIVFCVDIEHAERMRMALVNENPDMVQENQKYIVRMTGDDDSGKEYLDEFIDPASKSPVIATTSKLLNTGVDVQTCKLIVLDSNIQSMTEFKQMIGRGSRIREDYGKYFFTIMDFRQVTDLFADPDFDGEPVQIFEPKPGEAIKIPEEETPVGAEEPKEQVTIDIVVREKPRKYYVNGITVRVLNERVQYYDKNGKLITESLKDFTKRSILNEYSTLERFLQKWSGADRKSAVLNEIRREGILIDELKNEVGKDYDEFDLICHVAYDMKPLTRKERVNNVKKQNYFTKYSERAHNVIYALLDKYAEEGLENIEDIKVLQINPFTQFGAPLEIIGFFGGKQNYLQAVKEIETFLYQAA